MQLFAFDCIYRPSDNDAIDLGISASNTICCGRHGYSSFMASGQQRTRRLHQHPSYGTASLTDSRSDGVLSTPEQTNLVCISIRYFDDRIF